MKQAGGGYTRGKVSVEAKGIDDKSFLVSVSTMHAGSALKGGDDRMSLMLQARVQDGNREAIINLALLKNNEPLNNKGRWNGEHSFRLSYDDVNKYLQTMHPGLKLVPGAKLAVAAWATSNRDRTEGPPGQRRRKRSRHRPPVSADRRPQGPGGCRRQGLYAQAPHRVVDQGQARELHVQQAHEEI